MAAAGEYDYSVGARSSDRNKAAICPFTARSSFRRRRSLCGRTGYFLLIDYEQRRQAVHTQILACVITTND
jgi:hypothetical protein